MKICVLGTSDGWHFRDLQRAAGTEHQIENIAFDQLAATVGDSQELILEQFDCVFSRAMPTGSLQQVVFRMDVLLELERRGVPIINPPRTIETSVDKYLALTRLAAAGLPVPKTMVAQTVAAALEHFQMLGGVTVFKPLFGSMGRGLELMDNKETATNRFTELVADGEVIYQQELINHGGSDLRLLVIGDDVIGMKRSNPNQWITNIAQGASGQFHQPNDDEAQLAIDAARSVGAPFAGVDLVYDLESGNPYIIEINSAPAWQTISGVTQMDIAKRLLQELSHVSGEFKPVV